MLLTKFLGKSIFARVQILLLSQKEMNAYLAFYPSYIILKNGQTYFKNLAVFTPQEF